MCCHLAGPPERLVLVPKIHQGLRRKIEPCLVCSSADYKGLRGFFYLLLWFGPNHECQDSPVQLGIASGLTFCFASPLLQFQDSYFQHFHSCCVFAILFLGKKLFSVAEDLVPRVCFPGHTQVKTAGVDWLCRVSQRSTKKPSFPWHQVLIADYYLEIAILSSFISNSKLKWGVILICQQSTLLHWEQVCVYFGHFLLLQYIFASSSSQGGKKKPCNKRRIKAYFHWMSQHVKMGKAVQTVCVTREIRNI